MRIIDKTPFQNAQGEVDIIGRVRGTLKYGPSWYPELQAQKTVIAQLDRLLEKGYVVIRNFNLPGSEVIVPMILLGPNGIFMLYVTHLKGFYEAKGDQWNKVDQGRSLAVPRNLLIISKRLAEATQKYFELQKINISGQVEAIVIAADPGLNIETMRPITKVVKSDAINAFAGSLIQNRPVLRNEQVYALAERMVTPPEVNDPPQPAPKPAAQQPAAPASRAKAIFNAAESAPAFDSADLAFAFDEDGTHIAPQGLPPGLNESSPVRQLTQAPVILPKKKLFLGLTPMQWGILGAITFVWLCVMAAGGIYIVYFSALP
jgi:hypothetical protein